MEVVWIILFLVAEALLIVALMVFLGGTAEDAPDHPDSHEHLPVRSEHDRTG
jgi:hypothetical protein